MPDFAALRRMMVDTQVRPSDVTKLPLIQAMLHVPRERFVPDALSEIAYLGENLTLSPDRVILDPRTLSKMLDALAIGPTDLVLDVAPGLGYSSAVIAQLAEAVIALEPDADLAAEAETALAASEIGNVIVVNAPAPGGAPRHAPYDAVIIQGGIERFPAEIEDQIKEGGRAAALFMDGALGTARLGIKRKGVLRWRDAFNSSAPVLEGFAREQSFAL
ncbi:rRNA adenine N-6-methyltransferase family protein [Pararhodobacter sp. SW119]|uniref:protein-L-isoaspartate O-methyltransferase family protein n=1 Tax=Pararhodobacter sp. SW119 TaxID=2780075 RepID=UPI001AE0D12E|nr:rRNA adenine N-6-methyltransferase family protein [Pararhodobacter sp. SW119]